MTGTEGRLQAAKMFVGLTLILGGIFWCPSRSSVSRDSQSWRLGDKTKRTHTASLQSTKRPQCSFLHHRPYNGLIGITLTHFDKMPSSGNYSPVRSVLILVLSFVLPLLANLYSDRLSTSFAALRDRSKSSAISSVNNVTTQASPILASEQTVSSIL